MQKATYLFLSFLLIVITGRSQQAINFTITDVNGQTHELQNYLDNGQTVLLDFFFVDCPPCNEWMPEIVNIENDYEDEPLVIIACSDRDMNSAIVGFQNEYGSNGIAAGTEGGGPAVIDAYAAQFNFTGFPTYSVICPDGSITWDLWPLTAGVPTIRAALDACIENAVPQEPMADFTAEANCLSVSFTNNSINATDYLWSFNDGSTSTEANPVHLYDTADTYNVTLVASNSTTGLSNSTTVSLDIDDCTGLENARENLFHPYILEDRLYLTGAKTGYVGLYNSVGQRLFSSPVTVGSSYYHIPSIATGIYFIRMKSGDETYTSRIIKN